MKTLYKYEIDFGSTTYQTHAIPIHINCLIVVDEQGVNKGPGICEGFVLSEK
jgi:hypothetical protein